MLVYEGITIHGSLQLFNWFGAINTSRLKLQSIFDKKKFCSYLIMVGLREECRG